MTTNNTVTNDDLKSLCVKVDLLVLLTGHLRSIYLEKDDILDREFAKQEMASSSSLRGIQAQQMSDLQYQIMPFLVPSSRVLAFANLFTNVDDIVARTAGVSEYYDRVTERFNRHAYDMLATVKVEDDESLQTLRTEITECLNVVNYLNKLFR